MPASSIGITFDLSLKEIALNTATPKTPDYFMYFPEHYRWSADMLAIISTAPYGGAEISELDRAGRKLRDHLGDDQVWFGTWREGGDILRRRASTAEERGHPITAATNYLRACSHYQHADHFRHPKDDKALAVFRKSIDCFHKYAELTDRPRIEKVEIPYEGKSLPAYFIHAENTTEKRPPCIVRFGGFDTQKELQYLRGIPDLVRRGFSCLLVDGPGMGEVIRFRGILLRHDYEVVGTACVDYLETRPDVDKNRIAVIALSLGGYFAPRCAAFDKRFKACIAWGSMWDFHAMWMRVLQRSKNLQAKGAPLSVPAEHLMWVFGVKTLEEGLKKVEPFNLDGIAQELECPFLLLHGTNDEQVPLSDAETLFKAVGSKDKTFRVFTPEEGGAQHCQRDYLTLACDTMFDWLEEKLKR
jgi:pimeloyl-ACP methyl ester carboxylesterase